MSLRALARRGLLVVLVALSFLGGGLVVPSLVSATVSAGEREAFFPLPPTRISPGSSSGTWVMSKGFPSSRMWISTRSGKAVQAS